MQAPVEDEQTHGTIQEEIEVSFFRKLVHVIYRVQGVRGTRIVAFSAIVAPLLAITGLRSGACFSGIAFMLILVLGLQLISEREWITNLVRLVTRKTD